MISKCLFLSLVLAMIFSLFACGGPAPETPALELEEQPSTTAPETATPAPAAEKAKEVTFPRP